MERPSLKLQIALSLLIGVIVLRVLEIVISAVGGFLSQVQPGALPLIAVHITLGFIFLPLLLWRSTTGYVGAIVVGILAVFGWGGAAAIEIGAGNLPVEFLIAYVPGVIIGLLLIVYAYLAWREGA